MLVSSTYYVVEEGGPVALHVRHYESSSNLRAYGTGGPSASGRPRGDMLVILGS